MNTTENAIIDYVDFAYRDVPDACPTRVHTALDALELWVETCTFERETSRLTDTADELGST